MYFLKISHFILTLFAERSGNCPNTMLSSLFFKKTQVLTVRRPEVILIPKVKSMELLIPAQDMWAI